jgi:hypothetical protein
MSVQVQFSGTHSHYPFLFTILVAILWHPLTLSISVHHSCCYSLAPTHIIHFCSPFLLLFSGTHSHYPFLFTILVAILWHPLTLSISVHHSCCYSLAPTHIIHFCSPFLLLFSGTHSYYPFLFTILVAILWHPLTLSFSVHHSCCYSLAPTHIILFCSPFFIFSSPAPNLSTYRRFGYFLPSLIFIYSHHLSSEKPEEFGNAGADKEGEAAGNGAVADSTGMNDGSPPPAKKLKDGKGKAQDPHPYSYSHHRY